LSACRRHESEDEREDAPARNALVPVAFDRVFRGNFESAVGAVGSIEALRREKVLSPVAGRIVRLNVLEGSRVRSGEVLLTLRTREAQAAIDGAQSLLASASTERQKEEARRALALADSLQPHVSVRASLNGIVATRSVAEGELVAEQAELLTLIDPSTIVFIADVPLGSINAVRPGLSAIVQFPQIPDIRAGAVVDAIEPQAQTQSQSVKVRFTFRGVADRDRQRIRTGVPGVVRIITGTHRNVLLVRKSALLHDDESDTYSVVTVTPDSLALNVSVNVVAQNDSLAEIESASLVPGRPVITRGQYALADSTHVTAGR
jgi:multidrug efflux pump subunit AcrA (membrane-fusion protein)